MAMVIFEVLSGGIPFPDYDATWVVVEVPQGERPGRPQGAEGAWFMNDVWEMVKRCWSPQPESRPTAEAVVEFFDGISGDQKTLRAITSR